MSAPRINPTTGMLEIWTGSGYHPIPNIAATDVADLTRQEVVNRYQQGDSEREERIGGHSGWGINNLDPYSSISGLSPIHQFALQQGGTKDAFEYLLKSADKAGTRIKYVRQEDGSYRPTLAGVETWDSNPNSATALAVLAAPFIAAAAGVGAAGAGAGAGGAGGAAAGGLAAGEGAMIGSGLTGAADLAAGAAGAGGMFGAGGGELAGLLSQGLGGGATAGGTFGGMTAGGTLGGMTAGAGSLVPASLAGSLGPGFAAGLGGLGSLTPSAATLGSWNALAPSITGVSGAGAGSGMFSDLWSELPYKDVLQKYGPSLIKGGASLIGGRIGDRSARIADQDFRDSQIAQGGALRDAAGNYSKQLTGLFDKYKGAYDPFYAQVDNGIATSNIDPVTGKVGFSLNAPYQQQRDMLFGQAGKVGEQIGSADPRAFATERYNAAQSLLAPGDELSKQGLFQDLYSKGGFGLTLNQPAAASAAPGGGVTPGQGSVGVNPYLSTYLNAQNQRNAEMSYRSLGEGESYLDRLIGRQQGLFGAGQGIDTAGAGVMRDAFSASNQFMGDRRTAAGFGYGAEREAAQIPYQAEKDYINAMFGANQRFMGNQAAADQTKNNSYWDVAQKLPWGDIWTGISGLFGRGA